MVRAPLFCEWGRHCVIFRYVGPLPLAARAQAKTATIILRGGASQFIEEAERSLHDAIMVVRRSVKHSAIVAGAGAIEVRAGAAHSGEKGCMVRFPAIGSVHQRTGRAAIRQVSSAKQALLCVMSYRRWSSASG